MRWCRRTDAGNATVGPLMIGEVFSSVQANLQPKAHRDAWTV
jgi:hypothetical protein